MNEPKRPGAPIGASKIASAREALRSMQVRELVLAMRADDELAWSEFVERARRVLTATAR